MATITSVSLVSNPAPQGSACSINGSGFGASQGASLLIFFSVAGDPVIITPSFWSDTTINATLPANADVSNFPGTSYFVVQVGGTVAGARSDPFAVSLSTAAAVPPSFLPSGTSVYGKSGFLSDIGMSLPVAAPFTVPVGTVGPGASPPTTYNIRWNDAGSGITTNPILASDLLGTMGGLTRAFLSIQGVALPFAPPSGGG